mmetsp:Transcript_4596/g.7115  ORF Transcript_4596/g.7115 Transcript_4596/m.7115 type:complete len:201 (-) Transcript_4596:2258-2860(-)
MTGLAAHGTAGGRYTAVGRGHLGSKERVQCCKHVFVRPVVAQYQCKIDRLACRRNVCNELLDHDALIYALGLHLHNVLPVDDLHREVAQHIVEMVVELFGLHQTEIGVCISVMPYKSTLLCFDIAAVCPLCVLLEDRVSYFHPRQVHRRRKGEPLFVWVPSVVNTVFCSKAKVWDTAEPAVQDLSFTPTDNEDGIGPVLT